MILNTKSLTTEYFLRLICRHLCPDCPPPQRFASKGYTYIGVGYWRCRPSRDPEGKVIGLKLINPWRCRPSRDPEGKVIGLKLINPDFSKADLRLVEQGLAALLGLGFDGDVGIGEWERHQIEQGDEAQDGR